MALMTGSIFVIGVLLYSCRSVIQILMHWDITSGSELQLTLERKTYLITTIIFWTFCFQIISLLLFIYIADALSTQFTGAMCAAGSLALNRYGYPALIMKIANFLLAAVWLIVNAVDNRAPDYPLIKPKYLLLLIMTPLILSEALVQSLYFLSLEPDVITSCCGSLFGSEAEGVQSVLFALPKETMRVSFNAAMGLTFALGAWFYVRGSTPAGYLFTSASAGTFFLSIAAFISYMCLHFYELPTHNCPFCVLQRDYGYVGYPLYLCLLGGAALSLATGALMPFTRIRSLRHLPRTQRRLTLASLAMYGLFTAIVSYRIAVSDMSF